MFVHDIIKIRYSTQGYLPDYPYHLISDDEMCDAFLSGERTQVYSHINTDTAPTFQPGSYYVLDPTTGSYIPLTTVPSDWATDWSRYYQYDHADYTFTGSDYFHDNYPIVSADMQAEYNTLMQKMLDLIIEFKSNDSTDAVLPDWVYSYMLGAVVGPNSDKRDIHDLLVLLGCDNIDDDFDATACVECYAVSASWVKRFGINTDQSRPPTMFGEPHVIKSLRLQQIDN